MKTPVKTGAYVAENATVVPNIGAVLEALGV